MEIIEVTPEEYSQVVNRPYHVFNSAQFNSLNSQRCDQLFYWLFREGKFRLGLVGGLSNNTILSPFSAPYGGFSFLNDEIKLIHIEGAIDALIQTCANKQIRSIVLTLPPIFYNESFISKTINCLHRKDFIANIDLNYAFNLDRFHDRYYEDIWYNARKNLKISLSRGLDIIKCCDISEKIKAYEIIEHNRERRGFPLKMTWEQVAETANIINADFFLVKTSDEIFVASAIIYHVSDSIVQVIYWGDMSESNADKTMNFLSYKVFEYYKKTSIKYVDIGPSTENSLPNYGLCEFKESIGCTITPKLSFKYCAKSASK